MDRVLIIGGSGQVGRHVAEDLVTHTRAQVTITGRDAHKGTQIAAELGPRVQFMALDLSAEESLRVAIAGSTLTIHCAGPFAYRDVMPLQMCIDKRVNYLDVSDDRAFTQKALAYHSAAEAAGVTAIVNTGIFPGVSNSMVRQAVEHLDSPERIDLSYVVSGSGGAGVTVMRTTFLGLQRPFEFWRDGRWQTTRPYSDRETVQFPDPYGRVNVYTFDMPESFTLAHSFPVKTVTTKFGVVPDFYNHLTWMAAHWFPTPLLRNPRTVEFMANVSHFMTSVTDRFSGMGVGMRAQVSGMKDGRHAVYASTLVHPSAAAATGCGTGSLGQLLLEGRLQKPGVRPVEQAVSTPLFEQIVQDRQLVIKGGWVQEWVQEQVQNLDKRPR